MNKHQLILTAIAAAIPCFAMIAKTVTGVGLWVAYFVAFALFIFSITHP